MRASSGAEAPRDGDDWTGVTVAADSDSAAESAQYELVVEEDEEAEAAEGRDESSYTAPTASAPSGGAGRSADLTAQLKGLNTEELRGQTDNYKALKEARDLEDVLYSG